MICKICSGYCHTCFPWLDCGLCDPCFEAITPALKSVVDGVAYRWVDARRELEAAEKAANIALAAARADIRDIKEALAREIARELGNDGDSGS